MLYLTRTDAENIAQHARRDAPREACGLLAGERNVVKRVITLPNAAPDPETHYLIDPAAYIKAMAELDAQGLSLVGFYHSHPKGDPIPSPTDIREAAYPDAVYVIVGLPTESAQLSAWRIRYGQVESVEICTDTPTEAEPSLSRAQKFAIILSAVIAVLFMLLLSLSLLPPAPVIPVR